MRTKTAKDARWKRIGMFVCVLIVLCGASQRVAAQWVNNGAHITNTNPGNVGIGTMSPDVKLQIHHSSPNDISNIQLADLVLGLRNTNATNGNLSLLSFQDAAGWGVANIGAVHTDQANHSGDLIFLTRDNPTAYGERMRIKGNGFLGLGTASPGYKFDVQGGQINASGGLCIAGDCKTAWSQVGGGGSSQWTTSGSSISYSAGNVGIGTTAPTTKFHVAGDGTFTGNLTVNGNLAAKYQDVAEWVPASQPMTAGTVVVLDPGKSNHVAPSNKSYDIRVAGVISLQPGLSLGEPAEGSVLVATTGRVKVKVDACNGPIEIGDLLVTSDKEGVAMKSVPVDVGGVRIHRPGTLIGKALEPLAKGTGEILVLLSMQ